MNSEGQNGENLKENERKRYKRSFCFVTENRDPQFVDRRLISLNGPNGKNCLQKPLTKAIVFETRCENG